MGGVAWGRAASAACCACCRQERCKCGCTCCAAPHRLPAPIEPIRTACPAWPTAPGQHAPNPCCLVCSLSCLAQAAEPVLSCLFPFLLGAGGCVVSLGSVGRNVAAGMTGGLGYFYDEEGEPLGWREPFGWREPWVPVGALGAGGSLGCRWEHRLRAGASRARWWRCLGDAACVYVVCTSGLFVQQKGRVLLQRFLPPRRLHSFPELANTAIAHCSLSSHPPTHPPTLHPPIHPQATSLSWSTPRLWPSSASRRRRARRSCAG